MTKTATPADLYERYLVPALYGPAAQELKRVAQPECGDRVLDVACGTGVIPRTFAPIVGRSGEVTGLDVSPPMLAVARSIPKPNGAEITFAEGNAQGMTFVNESFDLVTCQQGLQFMGDKLRAMREMHRVLVPGGRAVVSVNQGFAHNRVYEQFNAVLQKLMGIPALASTFSFGDPQALKLLFTQAGFHNVDVKKVTVNVRFPDERAFITATMMASPSAVQAFKVLAPEKRAALVAPLYDEMQKIFAFYRQDEYVVLPLAMNIGSGVA
jgi:ubiquinone/menaquinone biosynthesis C-methylase UbiE